MPPLFDPHLRRLRRDRAARGPELFLLNRVFDDCLDRLSLIRRRFNSALLLGCPDPLWASRLTGIAAQVSVLDPGPRFASAADGQCVVEDEWQPPSQAYDLCVTIGTLDTVNDLPRALRALRASLRLDGLLLGAVCGGHSLPRLRAAMHAADAIAGTASPRVHPRIEAASLGPLLQSAGFVMPVVDVDRVDVAYKSFDRLVGDLRGMGATNVLTSRSRRPLSSAARDAARQSFLPPGRTETTETFELLHFGAWTPAGPQQG